MNLEPKAIIDEWALKQGKKLPLPMKEVDGLLELIAMAFHEDRRQQQKGRGVLRAIATATHYEYRH